MRLVETMDLPNGLRLEFWDESRPVAGDRWYVGLRAVIPVAIPEALEKSAPSIAMLKEALGGQAFYHHLMERHFIAKEQVCSLLREMRQHFLANSLSYLSHKEFPRRFLLAKSSELEKRKAWGAEYVEKLLQELRRPKSIPQEGELT
ncbi:MAG: hypothetical protein WHX93_09250 [bacterium]